MIAGGDDQHLRLAWYTRTRTSEPPGIWVSFVDALSGDLLSVHNEVRFLEGGSVWGTHDTRTVNGDYSTSPMPYIQVVGDSSSAYTDADGDFTLLTPSATAKVGLEALLGKGRLPGLGPLPLVPGIKFVPVFPGRFDHRPQAAIAAR